MGSITNWFIIIRSIPVFCYCMWHSICDMNSFFWDIINFVYFRLFLYLGVGNSFKKATNSNNVLFHWWYQIIPKIRQYCEATRTHLPLLYHLIRCQYQVFSTWKSIALLIYTRYIISYMRYIISYVQYTIFNVLFHTSDVAYGWDHILSDCPMDVAFQCSKEDENWSPFYKFPSVREYPQHDRRHTMYNIRFGNKRKWF